MKATYDNSFCLDSGCINNFEYMCMLCMTETGTEIHPFTDKERNSSECGEFRKGTFLAYVTDFGEDD